MRGLPEHVIVVADEVYHHFVESPDYPDSLSYVLAKKNIVIVHSFSKAYGMAGLRLGYGIARPALANYIAGLLRGFHQNKLALAAGIAACQDQDHVRRCVDFLRGEVRWLCDQFDRLDIKYWKPSTNFILFETAMPADELNQKLHERGFLMRAQTGNNLPYAIRVSAGDARGQSSLHQRAGGDSRRRLSLMESSCDKLAAPTLPVLGACDKLRGGILPTWPAFPNPTHRDLRWVLPAQAGFHRRLNDVRESNTIYSRSLLMPSAVNMRTLLETGVHFGHRTNKWNPKMDEFIFTQRNGIHIIDLQITLKNLNSFHDMLANLIAGGGSVLFVGTKRQAQEIVQREADRCGMPYVNYRWLGGTLTNWKTIRSRIDTLNQLEQRRDAGEFDRLTKKEGLVLERKIAKLQLRLGGIREMKRVPDLLVVVDAEREFTAVKEANILKIPVMALVDTNADPDMVDHILPANDDAMRSIRLLIGALG